MNTNTQNSFSKESVEDRKHRVEKIIQTLNRTYPDTTLALDFTTPLELLVALILAAQCADELVNQVTASLFKKYKRPQDWVAIDSNTLESEIRRVTFYRNKAKAIQKCCWELIDQFGGEVPDKLEDLVSLPGVGRKTANVLRGNAFGHPAIGVDRHVGRLSQRLGLTTETDPDKIEFDLTPLVSDKRKVRFCHLLQTHGRTICLARKPDCLACPVDQLCPYPSQSTSVNVKKRQITKK